MIPIPWNIPPFSVPEEPPLQEFCTHKCQCGKYWNHNVNDVCNRLCPTCQREVDRQDDQKRHKY